MTINNPFTYGNPISDPTHFFGRQREVEQVFSRLRNPEFESSSLVGERRIGKTSLLNYLRHPEVRRSQGLDVDKYLFIYMDLQMLGKDTTPAQLWQHLLQLIAHYCQDAEVKQTLEEMCQRPSISNFALADFFDQLDAKDLHIVLLLDEFEQVTANQKFDPAFFSGLRGLATQHNLALILSSCCELIELCHSEAIRSSPFFNIFANINLGLFSESEAHPFIPQSLAGTGVNFTDAEITLIFCLAGYHPYFLQVACYFLFEAYCKGLDSNERKEFLSQTSYEEATAHLEEYWRRSSDQEKMVLTALALLTRERKDCGYTFSLGQLQALYARSEQVLGHLQKRGLLAAERPAAEGPTYALFNESFGKWICSEITAIRYDQQGYEDWLKTNQGSLDRLSPRIKKELSEILPKIASKYRELIIAWVKDPNCWIGVAQLLATLLKI